MSPFAVASPGFFNGIRVIENVLAVNYHREVTVQKLPKKRRKRYRVRIREWTTPGAYQLADGTMVLHPTIYKQLRERAA